MHRSHAWTTARLVQAQNLLNGHPQLRTIAVLSTALSGMIDRAEYASLAPAAHIGEVSAVALAGRNARIFLLESGRIA
jgi:hypothetical protein